MLNRRKKNYAPSADKRAISNIFGYLSMFSLSERVCLNMQSEKCIIHLKTQFLQLSATVGKNL